MSEYRILEGDCLDVLATLPERSVQTCITSPPYFGLRDYGTAEWSGGDSECDHRQERSIHDDPTSTLGVPAGGGARRIGDANATVVGKGVYRSACGKCGATRTDSQIGLEETPEQYVANLVAVFREVRRVLRDDGTLWLNLGFELHRSDHCVRGNGSARRLDARTAAVRPRGVGEAWVLTIDPVLAAASL